MIKFRPTQKRGHEDKGWIESYHSFSFDTYIDPDYLGYHAMRVLNEEYLKGGKGTGEQFHKDLEIVTFVLEGALEYKDNLGNTLVIREGEVQVLSTGTGVLHSEYNLSHQGSAHFVQIWFNANQNNLAAEVNQKIVQSASKWGQWCLMVSHNGREGSLRIHQDVDIYSTILDKEDEVAFDCLIERFYWLQVLSGSFMVQKQILHAGDGLAISDEMTLVLSCLQGGEILLIDQGET